MKSLPIVALIGQTNAGKSSLLNRFAHKKIAIVAREAGTTRDSVTANIDDQFLLIDTAGLKTPEDDFEATIMGQVEDAISSADLILLTLDATKYPDDHDKRMAKTALRSKKPVLLLLNKSDYAATVPPEEFLRLGIKPASTFATSATTGQGIKDLKQAIQQILATSSPAIKHHTTSSSAIKRRTIPPAIKLALIGRPNVGKSSLFNTLAKKQQALVSPLQNTTRDVNRTEIKYQGQQIEILDTAGLRKPGKREVGIEKFSALRTLAAIEEADICALLIDATEPHAKLDQTLAGQIVDAGKSIILVVTKSDLLKTKDTPSATDTLLDRLEQDFNFLPYAPVLITSSQTGKNVTKLFDLTLLVNDARHTQIPTPALNNILRSAIADHPPAGLKNTHPKPKYIVQTDTCPPWFVLHGREMQLMHWSYKRYLERKIRESYPLIGTPIVFSFHNE